MYVSYITIALLIEEQKPLDMYRFPEPALQTICDDSWRSEEKRPGLSEP